MKLGDNIKTDYELFIYTIIDNFINILQELRNIDKKTFNIKSINYNDNCIENDSFFIKVFNFKVTNIKKNGLLNIYNSHKDKKIIFIVETISSKLYTEIVTSYDNIEIFLINDIIHNCYENILQCKYKLLNKEEVDVLKKNYSIFDSKIIPKIKKSDIIVRLFNAKVNDIFQITRFDSQFGKDIFYRIVINSNYDDIFTN